MKTGSTMEPNTDISPSAQILWVPIAALQPGQPHCCVCQSDVSTDLGFPRGGYADDTAKVNKVLGNLNTLTQAGLLQRYYLTGFPANLEIRRNLQNDFHFFQSGKSQRFWERNSSNQGKIREFRLVRLFQLVSLPNSESIPLNDCLAIMTL